ncbi:MAG: hypothetical protein AB7Q17_16260 [Phycisphaerae bacterium]
MRFSKRERVGAMVLLVGIGALAADRLLFPAPQDAEGALIAPARSPRAPATAVFAAVPAPALPPADLVVPDVFDSARVAALGGRAPSPVAAVAPQADAFAREHAVHATILGPQPLALVDERLMRAGDELDGFVLHAIHRGSVEFVSGVERVVLRVAPLGHRRRGTP